MFSMQEIKSRIATVNKIKKITKAMQLVATAKLTKNKKKWKEVQKYYRDIYDIFNNLVVSSDDLKTIFGKSESTKTLYIIITSDLGLCGSYNHNIIKLAKKHLQPNDDIIIIGTKGISAFKETNYQITDSFEDVHDAQNYLVASEIAKNAVIRYLEKEIKAIKVIYTAYVNSISYYPKIETIIPMLTNQKKVKLDQEMEFEPNLKTIMINSLPLYVAATLYNIMIEAKVSEMSSRRLAMENANDNADEVIDNLNLKYNRARQAKITQEIAEIITGSEADLK